MNEGINLVAYDRPSNGGTEVNERGRQNSHNSEEDEIRKRKNNI